MARATLFDLETLPVGFRYQEEFIAADEEQALLEAIRGLDFHDVRMRGVTARRRVVQYGVRYSFESYKATAAPPIPPFLLPLRDRAAVFAAVDHAAIAEALVTEYPAGAPIGWHRDAPSFGIVVGISLLTSCRFRFRQGRTGAWDTRELILAPRSAYLLTGPARSEWQHSIPHDPQLRYSITFRTMRRSPGRSAVDRGP